MANVIDRVAAAVSPGWAARRARARLIARRYEEATRHYEAAAVGRRTSGWNKSAADADSASAPSLWVLRALARDLVRNNPWARRAVRRIAGNAVGWGIAPKPAPGAPAEVGEAWRRWAGTTDCDADGRLTFYGIQRQVMETVAESGEVLVRRRFRRPEDGLAVPLQLQVLEPDHIDASRDGFAGVQGGPTIRGVEHDAIGRRVAYWLFSSHPGSSRLASPSSARVSADLVAHVFRQERPGQVRGVSWFAPAIIRLRDFDEYEDATLMKQKVQACFAAFVTDVDGLGAPLAQGEDATATEAPLDRLQPGLVSYLPPGKTVTFANPTGTGEFASFSVGALRAIAVSLGCTYEELTGDYSQFNYAAGRSARLAQRQDVLDWQWNMLVPLLCAPVWSWFLAALASSGASVGDQDAPATWTPPAAPMVDPEKEGNALSRLVRTGAMTHDEMVREQGYDPEEHWAEYAAGLGRLDALGITLDSDARRTTQGGIGQQQAKPAPDGPAQGGNGHAPPEDDEGDDEGDDQEVVQ